jgi:hypothetical protein
MKKTSSPFLATALLALLGAASFALSGCKSAADSAAQEAAAQQVLDKNDHAFEVCKQGTEEKKMAPGKHNCSRLMSIALDGALQKTGLDEAKAAKMRDEWLEKKGYKEYYIPKEQRQASQ